MEKEEEKVCSCQSEEDVQKASETLKNAVEKANCLVNKLMSTKVVEELCALTSKLKENAELLKNRAQKGRVQLQENLEKTEEKIVKNPLASVGIALGIGVLIGSLFFRGKR